MANMIIVGARATATISFSLSIYICYIHRTELYKMKKNTRKAKNNVLNLPTYILNKLNF